LGKGFVYSRGSDYNALVRKLVQITLFFVAVIATVVGFIWFVSREPVYQGKRLREWIQGFIDGTDSINAVVVVRAYGTNGIPFYLKLLQVTRPGLKDKLLDILERHNLPRFGLSQGSLIDAEIGRLGFTILGPEARSAVPALTKLVLTENLTGNHWSPAGLSLAATGLDGAKALTILLHNSNPKLRAHAAFFTEEYAQPFDFWINANTGLPYPSISSNNVESSAPILVPALIPLATDANREVRIAAIEALGKFACEPEKVMPILTAIVQNLKYDRSTRIEAIRALGEFGSSAKGSIPPLLRVLQNGDTGMRREAGIALKKIAPDEAAKAGVE